MKLTDKIESQFRINIIQKKALKRLGLETVRDLLYYFPSRYTEMSKIQKINTIISGETITILGTISKPKISKSFRSKIPMGQATLTDLTGSAHIVWFHQPYLVKIFKEGSIVRVTGKVSETKNYGLTLTNPIVNKSDVLPIDSSDSLFSKENKSNQATQFGYPVYSESRGITSKWIYHTINKILKSDCVNNIIDYLPQEIIDRYKLPSLHTSLVWIHMPQKKEHADIARKRFAFEEIFFIQLTRQKERQIYQELPSYKLKIFQKDINDFISRFPFKPTKAQNNIIKTILADLKLDKPMSRLLEGDVGSGKTFIAATIAYSIIKNRPFDQAKGRQQNFGNLQVAYMAPTEVLAIQLYESFIEYFSPRQNENKLPISIALVTGNGCRKFPSKSASWNKGKQIQTWTPIAKNQLLKWIKNGEIPIVIGTHALISKSVDFENLGLVIIDEQHRFGIKQRMQLIKKRSGKSQKVPHYLSMTATPIPRTLALTIYGDLDLSILDQMPPGRKKVITEIVSENKRNNVYKKVKKELEKGRQLYVICQKIESPDEEDSTKLDIKSVTSEAKRLKKEVFGEYNIEIMHSKIKKEKKAKIMLDFSLHKIDILVSTSIIEVGVNIPNATIIIIEGAERFGLAQLHQLRGRVIRSTFQSYCYLFANAKTDKTLNRLKALSKTSNGFELAELDLSLRGAGLLSGNKQWGITDLGMEAIKNIKMVEAARIEAVKIVKKDRNLDSQPLLAEVVASKNTNLYLE